jgi:hypothetical protein
LLNINIPKNKNIDIQALTANLIEVLAIISDAGILSAIVNIVTTKISDIIKNIGRIIEIIAALDFLNFNTKDKNKNAINIITNELIGNLPNKNIPDKVVAIAHKRIYILSIKSYFVFCTVCDNVSI